MSSVTIPDGEYEIDMSSLFSSSSLSEIFGIRYGFKPDNIDNDYYSLLVKDQKDDSYILRTESKNFGKTVVTTNHNRLNQIFFEGKAPHITNQQQQVQQQSQQQQQQLNISSVSHLLSNNNVTSNTTTQVNNHSEYILIYDKVQKLFKMERYGGAIKLGKSREPDLLNKKINELSNNYMKLSKDAYAKQSGGLTTIDLIDSLIKQSNNTNTNTISNNNVTNPINNNHNTNSISYKKSISGISPMRIAKKKLAPSSSSSSQTNTPRGTPKFIPVASPSVGQLSRPATPTPPTSTPSTSIPTKTTPPIVARKRPASSGPTTVTTGTKAKRSKLLRAAERAVRSNKRTRSAPIEPPVNNKSINSIKKIPKLKVNAGLGISSASAQISGNVSSTSTGTPLATESDIEEIKLGSPITLLDENRRHSKSLEKPGKLDGNNDSLSDEDIELMASELEEELENSSEEESRSTTISQSKPRSKSKPKSIVEVMQGDNPVTLSNENKSNVKDEIPKVIITSSTTSETKKPLVSTANNNIQEEGEDDDWDVDLSDWDDVIDEDDQLDGMNTGFQVIVDENPTSKRANFSSYPEVSKTIVAPVSASVPGPAAPKIQTPSLDISNSEPKLPATNKKIPKKQVTKHKVGTDTRTQKKATTPPPKLKATKRPPPPQPVKTATDEAIDEAFAELEGEDSDDINNEFDEEFDRALESLEGDEDEDEVSEEE